MERFFANKKHNSVLVIGCFHGDEPQGKYLAEEYIKENPDTLLMFIPCLNESGVKLHRRGNKNGVDLNRNFPASNWVLSDRDEYFGGESPASEEETRFVIDIVKKFLPKLVLTLHAPYKTVNYDGNAREAAEKISEITGYPVTDSIGYPTPGSFGTWAGLEKNIPVITLELDDTIEVQRLKEPIFKVFKLLEGY